MFKRNCTGEFGDIPPYNAQEAAMAFEYMRRSPHIYIVSKCFFPNKKCNYFKRLLSDINTVEDFQQIVMNKVVGEVIDRTTDGLTFDGIENLLSIGDKGCFLAVSNHRDIVLDPAFVQYILIQNNLPVTQIAVGDNLMRNNMVTCLMRCNRMIKVVRGISARELYAASKSLSSYIRQTISSGKGSVWIAQKEGRAKNGQDLTEQGVLKMFEMSGKGDFCSNFSELHIVPVSISYEYEPCDIKKAKEVFISKDRKYVKKKGEDMRSILTGIRQQKGRVHIHFGAPLSDETLKKASECQRNERYHFLMTEMDRTIISNYKLWKTNYMACDLMEGSTSHSCYYSKEDLESFQKYIEHQLNKAEKSLNRKELKDVFLHIYGNPVKASESLQV